MGERDLVERVARQTVPKCLLLLHRMSGAVVAAEGQVEAGDGSLEAEGLLGRHDRQATEDTEHSSHLGAAVEAQQIDETCLVAVSRGRCIVACVGHDVVCHRQRFRRIDDAEQRLAPVDPPPGSCRRVDHRRYL